MTAHALLTLIANNISDDGIGVYSGHGQVAHISRGVSIITMQQRQAEPAYVANALARYIEDLLNGSAIKMEGDECVFTLRGTTAGRFGREVRVHPRVVWEIFSSVRHAVHFDTKGDDLLVKAFTKRLNRDEVKKREVEIASGVFGSSSLSQ